jgi:G3E family GTPase
MRESLPVNILTGFLGSGKTTLLRQLLASPKLADTAVLINEFGDVGLDHLLVETVDDDVVLLQSGCICCTIRGDLSKAILNLYSRRERGEIPRFARLTIETTGLADPTPILSTILHDPVLRHHFHLGNVITTVDGINGLSDLDGHPETVKQAAVADRIVITKTDLVDQAEILVLRSALRRLNPAAPVLESVHGILDANLLLGEEAWNEKTRSREVRRWLEAERHEAAHRHHHDHPLDRNRHARDIRTFCLTLDRPIEWAAFGIWLTLLLHRHGSSILRVKGVLDIAGSNTPVVVQGVQHLVYEPMHLDTWPFEDRRSRLVFIVQGLEETIIRESLGCFQALSRESVEAA